MGTSLIFSLDFAGRKKGRESKTVRERQAYSPEGYCIGLLPAMNDRRMHLYLYMCRGHKKRQGLRGWLPVSEEFSAPRTGKHSGAVFVKLRYHTTETSSPCTSAKARLSLRSSRYSRTSGDCSFVLIAVPTQLTMIMP